MPRHNICLGVTLSVFISLAAAQSSQSALSPSGPGTPASALPAQATQGGPQNLSTVRRIYVAPLAGGAAAEALRELIISSLDSTRLFTLTDNAERADAVLKGAADDRVFTDSFDSDKGLSDRANGGAYTSSSKISKLGGFGGLSVDDRDSHHIRERKHEAYATVRLCSRTGDVVWSTTQESLGSKFRGASADVAAKIARQIFLNYQVARTQPAQ